MESTDYAARRKYYAEEIDKVTMQISNSRRNPELLRLAFDERKRLNRELQRTFEEERMEGRYGR